MNIKERIKEIIDKKGITIRELASKINMSEQNLYKCFRRNSIELKYLEQMSEFLEIPLSYFFNENETISSNKLEGNKNITLQNNNLGDNNKVSIMLHDKDEEIEKLKREIDHLKSLLEAKDKIISLLERK